MRITILPSSPSYPTQFALISTQLHSALRHESAAYISIEHIGSTSIPGLPAKPIIDIAIVIPHEECFDLVKQGLNFGGPGCEGPSYVCIGDGGVRGRWSFKCRMTGEMGFGELETIKEGRVKELEGDAEATLKAMTAARGQVYPQRNVYVVVEGSLLLRAWRDLVRVLSDEKNAELKQKYGETKMRLGQNVDEEFIVGMQYSMAKDEVVAEILRVAGWTEDEIKEKEGLVRKWWEEDGWDE